MYVWIYAIISESLHGSCTDMSEILIETRFLGWPRLNAEDHSHHHDYRDIAELSHSFWPAEPPEKSQGIIL